MANKFKGIAIIRIGALPEMKANVSMIPDQAQAEPKIKPVYNPKWEYFQK